MFVRTESFKEFIRYYPVVTFILFIHILLYLILILPFFPSNWLFETLMGINLSILHGEYWRLVTPIFLHSGFSHVLFNSFSLILFAPALERILGKPRFIFLYLTSGIIANLATLALKPPSYTHVGSSGAIFGLFGVYLAIVFLKRELITRENSQVILTIAAIGILMTFLQPNINVTAHIFGLLAGFILGSIIIGKGRTLSTLLRNFTHNSKKQLSFTDPKTLFVLAIILLAVFGLFSGL